MESLTEVTVSVHIYRTAGNTFGEYLREVFGNKHYFNDYEKFPAQYVQIPEDKDVCIHGHIEADKYEDRFPNAHLITWVRNPLQRIISNYIWWQRIEYVLQSEDWEIFKKENWTLTQFALRSSEGYKVYDKMLCYSKGHKISGFRFIGIMEQFERSIRLFNKIYGIENPPEYESYFINMDRSKYKDSKYRISLNEAEVIIEANLIEFEIYEKAKMHFENLCDKYEIDQL